MSYSTAGSAHSILTSAPGMYRHNNNQRSHTSNKAPFTALGVSLELYIIRPW